MLPEADPTTDLYNMVAIKNPMSKDFVFGYDNKGKYLVYKDAEGNKMRVRNPNYNQEGNYIIRAGETRNFPKFIAQVAAKHLIDKILLQKDKSGTMITNQIERDKIAKVIIVKEEQFERPTLPTDQQLVEQMNTETDLDRVLSDNKKRLKEEQPDAAVNVPEEPQPQEQFDGLEPAPVPAQTPKTTSNLPSREKMVGYAVNTLGMDPETVIGADGPNKGRTYAEIWESMTDQELFNELQLQEGDL